MTILKTYVADDGTKFQTYEECACYEEELKALEFSDTAAIFDENGKLLPMTTGGFFSASYVVAKTQEAAEFMYELFKEGFITPWDSQKPCEGCWYSGSEGWVSAEEVLKTANILQKIKEL